MRKFVYLLLLSLIPLQPLYGKVIQIQTQFRTDLRPDELIAIATITNQGDEPSRNVQLGVEWGGKTTSLPVHPTVSIQESVAETFHLPIRGLKPGHYPILLRYHYADTNLYPFSGLTAMIVNFKTDSNLGLWGTLSPIAIRNSGRTRIKFKNLETISKTLRIRLLLPDDLSAEQTERESLLQGRQEKAVSFVVKNFSALPGSTLNIYALIEYDQNGIHYAALAPGSVRILDSALNSKDLDFLWMGLAVFLAAAILVGHRLYRARRTPRIR